jgi:hypothetical protein
LVEHQLPKLRVAGSIPVVRFGLMTRSARETRLFTAVTLLGIAVVGIVALVLVGLWRGGNDNLAGWVTTGIVMAVLFFGGDLLGLERRFQQARTRTRVAVVVAALVLAIGGGAAYLAWPGSASWYLAALPALPAVLVSTWFSPVTEDEVRGFDGSDGPWSAP